MKRSSHKIEHDKINVKSLVITVFSLLLACSCDFPKKKLQKNKLFSIISSESSGVDFINKIVESENFHYYKYIYAYNGGGVASADFDNDGLIDLIFTSNTGQNKLYKNKGNFKFDDITESSGIKAVQGFNTGVNIVDINSDGFLDIYICRAGWFKENSLYSNLLYINNKDLTFSEKAEEYGLDDKNRSMSSTFFDYDNDGDLDAYICNSPIVTKGYNKIMDLDSLSDNPETITLKGSDKLYQNDGTGHYKDISIIAGIFPERGFGLHAQVGDANNDGWQDIYVSNDFETPDFFFINNGDGTFSDKRDDLLKHMSFYSMGSDMADINNDGLTDLMVLDMNPEDYVRSKTTMSMTSVDKFSTMIKKGYHHQFMHNTLQLNNGNSTYSEVSQMAGVANTDWSWSTLIADFDLDGFNDIYVTNGVYRDVIEQDKTNEIYKSMVKKGRRPTDSDFLEYIQMFPQQKLENYFFRNKGNLTFENKSTDWANQTPTFSNGATYADLDNDGDLDLVVNNINERATLLKNNSTDITSNNFIQFEFQGPDGNRFGNGAMIYLKLGKGKLQTRQLINSRGYLSAVSNKLHFGIGLNSQIPLVEIKWPDGKIQQLSNLKSNQLVTVYYEDAKVNELPKINEFDKKTVFKKVNQFKYFHEDIEFNDYEKQLLLPHKLSQTGPGVSVSDVNDDGLDDIYLGGGHGQAGQLLLGNQSGGFKPIEIEDFISDSMFEDVSSTFFDADNDGDKDLYVVSGSYEFAEDSPLLQDRLYLNNGIGFFEKADNFLPQFRAFGSVVTPADFDNDGDIDLFVGSRVIPGKYPYAPTNFLLVNKEGHFSINTKSLAPELERIGMITDAKWHDIDNDNDLDLIVAGEWMGIEVFLNEEGNLIKSENFKSLSSVKGWWNKIVLEDIDNDGDQDIIAGNLGLNYKFHATKNEPFHVYTDDFDDNGIYDIILAKYYKDQQVPVRGKNCTAQQMPFLQKNVKTYQDFASKDLIGIFGKEIESALHYEANEFRSGIFLNEGQNKFSFIPFSNHVQKSPINSIVYSDFDKDGFADLLLAGNNYHSEIETTRADAGIGIFLKGNGKGNFSYLPNLKTGFIANKDVRDIVLFKTKQGKNIMVVNNNSKHIFFKY